MVELMAQAELSVDDKSHAHRADTKPLQVSPEDLRLGDVQRQARRSSAIEGIVVPGGLGYGCFGYGSTYRAALYKGKRCSVELGVIAIVGPEIAAALPQVCLSRGEDKGAHGE